LVNVDEADVRDGVEVALDFVGDDFERGAVVSSVLRPSDDVRFDDDFDNELHALHGVS
jgi:hypothetical protein